MSNIKNGYLLSTNVKVFPSAYRESEFDPEARLNTEANFTIRGSNVSDLSKSYIVKWVDQLLVCVIAGYKFELTLTSEELAKEFADQDIYLKIKLEPRLINGSNTNTYVLGNLENNEDLDSQIDLADQNTKYFTGLKIIGCPANEITGLIDNEPNIYTLRILKADGSIDNVNTLPKLAAGTGDNSIILNSQVQNPESGEDGNLNTIVARAEGESSLAANSGIAKGRYSVAFNTGTTLGNHSAAFNAGNAYAPTSVAFNAGNAKGPHSAAFNTGNVNSPNSAAFNDGIANGQNSAAFGKTTASGQYQMTVGRYNKSDASALFLIGAGTGDSAEQLKTVFKVDANGADIDGTVSSTGNYSTTNGNITTTNGNISAGGDYSTTDGNITTTNGNVSAGGNISVGGNYSTTNGNITTTNGKITTKILEVTADSTLNGITNTGNITSTGEISTDTNLNVSGNAYIGQQITINGGLLNSGGIDSTGDTVLTEGILNFGTSNTVSGDSAAVFGISNIVTGKCAGAFGHSNEVSANYAFAKGTINTASGINSLALGNETTASGVGATTFGTDTTASGKQSTAFGNNSSATGDNSMSIGLGTIAGQDNELAIGKYNKDEYGALFIVGNGTSAQAQSNALIVKDTGETVVSDLIADTATVSGILSSNTISNTNNIITSGLIANSSLDVKQNNIKLNLGTSSGFVYHNANDHKISVKSTNKVANWFIQGGKSSFTVKSTDDPTWEQLLNRWKGSSFFIYRDTNSSRIYMCQSKNQNKNIQDYAENTTVATIVRDAKATLRMSGDENIGKISGIDYILRLRLTLTGEKKDVPEGQRYEEIFFDITPGFNGEVRNCTISKKGGLYWYYANVRIFNDNGNKFIGFSIIPDPNTGVQNGVDSRNSFFWEIDRVALVAAINV